jgi:hypothetical protein
MRTGGRRGSPWRCASCGDYSRGTGNPSSLTSSFEARWTRWGWLRPMLASTYYRLGNLGSSRLWPSRYLFLVPCTKVSEKDISYQDVHIGCYRTLGRWDNARPIRQSVVGLWLLLLRGVTECCHSLMLLWSWSVAARRSLNKAKLGLVLMCHWNAIKTLLVVKLVKNLPHDPETLWWAHLLRVT